MSKIKVALCLTGDVRNDIASFPYIYEILNQNSLSNFN